MALDTVPGRPAGTTALATWRTRRTVLVAIHHWMAGDRLGGIVPALLEADPRVQVVYTLVPGSRFEAGGREYLRRLDAAVVPWEQAAARGYDLAVAAGHGRLEQIQAPVLVLPHGVGFSKLVARRSGYGPPVPRTTGGAVHSTLVSYGRVVPALLGVAHEHQRAVVADAVPEAARICRVVGDPCYDRMVAAAPDREAYRDALGVRPGRRLVVLSSSWGPAAALGRQSDLPLRLVRELPSDRYAVAAVLHPGAWWVHGPRQVRAWLAAARGAGLRLLRPDSPWEGLLVASDAVVGDHGSVTCYAAALGRPVLLASFPDADIAPGSQAAALGAGAPRLRAGGPLLGPVDAAVRDHPPEQGRHLSSLLTSAPGESARRLRRAMYELLRLPEPDAPPGLDPVPAPALVPAPLSGGRSR